MPVEIIFGIIAFALIIGVGIKLWSSARAPQNNSLEFNPPPRPGTKLGPSSGQSVSSTSFFQSPGGSIFYRTIGKKENPPLLLLHGIGSSEFCWRHNVEALSEKYFLVLPDFLGFGQSDKKMTDSFTFLDHEKGILGLLDHLKIEKTDLISCSMGGAIGLWMASRNPQRFSKIVSVAPAASPKIVPGWARNLKAFSGMSTSMIGSRFLGRRIMMYIMKEIYRNHSIIDRDSVDTYLKPYLGREAHLAFSIHLSLLGRPDTFRCLSKVQSEVLLVQGGEDRIVSAQILDAIAKEIPNASLLRIPHAGHHPMEEAPLEFNKIALAFLSPTT